MNSQMQHRHCLWQTGRSSLCVRLLYAASPLVQDRWPLIVHNFHLHCFEDGALLPFYATFGRTATPCTSSRRLWAGLGLSSTSRIEGIDVSSRQSPPGAYACHVSKGPDRALFAGVAISCLLFACSAGLDKQAPFFRVGWVKLAQGRLSLCALRNAFAPETRGLGPGHNNSGCLIVSHLLLLTQYSSLV